MNTDLQATPKSPAPEARTLAKPQPTNTHYSEVKILHQIDAGKFKIFLAKSQQKDKKYALKVFPFVKDEVCSLYTNEKKKNL